MYMAWLTMAQPSDGRKNSTSREAANSTESEDGGFRNNETATRNLTGRGDHDSTRHRTNVRRPGEDHNTRALEHIEQLEHQQQEEEESKPNS